MPFLHHYDTPADYRLVRIGSGPLVLMYSGGDPILTPHYLCVECRRRLLLEELRNYGPRARPGGS